MIWLLLEWADPAAQWCKLGILHCVVLEVELFILLYPITASAEL